MSEFRQKIEGFSWPSHLKPEIRWLARDGNGTWCGYEFKPFLNVGTKRYPGDWWEAQDGLVWHCDAAILPAGDTAILLCRDDCETSAVPTGTEARVCEDIARRQQLGITKYGVTVAENPLTHLQWLRHAYEECLDFAIYLRRAIETHEAVQLEQQKPSSP